MLDNNHSYYLDFRNGKTLINDRHWVNQGAQLANRWWIWGSVISVFPLGGNQTEKGSYLKSSYLFSHLVLVGIHQEEGNFTIWATK